MNREDRNSRHYDSTPLSTLQTGLDIDQNKDILLKLYDQVCSSWKMLVDVRFKLLGLVPTVSLALLATILTTKEGTENLSSSARLLISALGALTSLGLFIYDKRNSELHDDLISRGRKIEEELKIDTGIFRGRLNSSRLIKHDIATNIIYYSTFTAWGVAIIFILLQRNS